MTAEDRRLVALAALLSRDRATALVGRVASPAGARLAAEAGRLAGAPRQDRLAALGAALAPDLACLREAGEAAASLEGPRVAAVLRAVATGACDAALAAPALARLCRERLGA